MKNMEKKELLGKTVASLQRYGKSLYMLVPKKYADEHDLTKGSKMTVFYNSILHGEPVTDEEILRKVTRVD